MAAVQISRQALKRLPAYLQYLKQSRVARGDFVTATAIAEALRLNEIQVRKDIAAVSSQPGKPMVGFHVPSLIRDMEKYIRYESARDAVLVGTGALGLALTHYTGFAAYDLNIIAAFDERPVSEEAAGCAVYPMGELEHICRRLNVRLGVIAVPAEAAQSVCDALVASGVRAIWNFAPTFLRVPEGIIVQDELLASSAVLLMREMDEREANRR